MHWLIAEDEADIRNLVATMAQVWGHTPLVFESGGRAWEYLETVIAGTHSGNLPEFALMDIRMPGKRGDEVAKHIRETPLLADIPVVLMTAFVLSDDERQAMMTKSGVDHIINKPLPGFMELKTLLDDIIAKKAAQNAAKPKPAPVATPAVSATTDTPETATTTQAVVEVAAVVATVTPSDVAPPTEPAQPSSEAKPDHETHTS